MRAVIEGELYDTQTDECLGMATADLAVTDFRYWQAGLYRMNRTGQFFLAGIGGPMKVRPSDRKRHNRGQ